VRPSGQVSKKKRPLDRLPNGADNQTSLVFESESGQFALNRGEVRNLPVSANS
jgi:hypothetical protein